MKMTDTDMLLQILEWISSTCFHQIHYFHDGRISFSTLESPSPASYAIENPFRCNPELFSTLASSIGNQTDKESIFRPCLMSEADNPNICYGILEFTPKDVLVIGPVALFRLSSIQLRQYIKANHIKDHQNYFIRRGTVPQLTAILSLLSYILIGETRIPQLHFPETKEPEDFMRLQKYQLDNSEIGTQHLPYKIEDYFMSCIRDGDLDAFEKMLDGHLAYSTGTMSKSAIKQEEYTSVVSVSLMARAAIEGGVDPYYAYDMNDLYLQQISTAKTQTEYQKIATKASRDFIQAVKRSRALQSQSVHTEKCKQYIVRHLNSRFTLDELAEDLGLNRTYISGLFRQYEGMTLTEYTHRERINAAKNMLRYSDYGLAQIAEYFCFYSQSHFGKIFKKYTGITPQQYRRQAKNRSF